MKRLLFALALLILPAIGQDQPKPQYVQRLVQVKYINASAFEAILTIFPVKFRFNQQLGVVALDGPADQVAAVEAVIKQLDVPVKNVELTMYFMVGSEGDATVGNPMPKDLESVATQLRTALAFKSYRLLDVLQARTRAGATIDTNSSGASVTLNNVPYSINIHFTVRSTTVASDGSTVRLDGMRCGLRWPMPSGAQVTYSDLGLNADVDIKEGQKVVVGRLGVVHDQALFLVLTARIVN